MLKIAGRDHHAVDILAGQHLFRILIGLRLEIEGELYLGCTVLPGQAPQVTYGNRLHRHLLGRQVDHVDVALTTVSAAQLTDTDAVVRSQHPRIGAGVHPRSQQRSRRLLHKCSPIDSQVFLVCHLVLRCRQTHTSSLNHCFLAVKSPDVSDGSAVTVPLINVFESSVPVYVRV